MLKLSFLLFFGYFFGFSQEVNKSWQTYQYGHNGMQLVVNENDATTIVSTFNSKMTIKDDIAQKVYDYVKKDTNICSGDTVIIEGKDANVIGKLKVKKRGKLTAIFFEYESVYWNNGLTEIYMKKS